jgi:phosphatidylinositol alpha-1,6-mannosyltransferase
VGIRDHVIFAGRVSEDALPDIYALSDVFVMPSRDQREVSDVEGFGLVFLEANACGKPVIGGRSGGIPDAIVDGVTGLLVNPDEPEDIAHALVQLLTNRDLTLRLGQQGRLRVARDFNWARVGDRVQRILDCILLARAA